MKRISSNMTALSNVFWSVSIPIVMLLIAGLSARAAVTNIISGVQSNYAGNFYVGSNSAYNYLEINSAGSLSNANGYIGWDNLVANSNRVLITGVGSVWTNGNLLVLGNYGKFNELKIEDGGRVVCSQGWIGREAGDQYGSITVNGAGSEWYVSSELLVGRWGRYNTLIVTNGGRVRVSGDVTVAYNAALHHNKIIVTDAGSLFTNSGTLYLGQQPIPDGSANITYSNEIWVLNGARVESVTAAYIGYKTNVNDNVAVVSGTGSVWKAGLLTVGYYGSRNGMRIEDGGSVLSGNGDVGQEFKGYSNSLTISGSNSSWAATGNFNVGRYGCSNTATITNGGRLACAGEFRIGYTTSGINPNANNTLIVTGPGSLCTNGNTFYVGNGGWYGTLRIENGGKVVCPAAYIGYNFTASNNIAFVSGQDSVWTITNGLTIGNVSGAFNNGLIMSNAGCVSVVKGTVAIGTAGAGTGYVTNYVQGLPSGLDLGSSAGLTANNGKMHIVFEKNPQVTGPYWGLRWAGNHVASLQALTNSPAKLTWDDSAMDSYWQNKVSIYYDSTNTYVGFDVTHIPVKGTIISFR